MGTLAVGTCSVVKLMSVMPPAEVPTTSTGPRMTSLALSPASKPSSRAALAYRNAMVVGAPLLSHSVRTCTHGECRGRVLRRLWLAANFHELQMPKCLAHHISHTSPRKYFLKQRTASRAAPDTMS